MSIDHKTEDEERKPLPPGIAFDPWERFFSEDMKRSKLPDQLQEQIPELLNTRD